MDSKDECRASCQGYGKERRIGCCRLQPKTGSTGTKTGKAKRTVLMVYWFILNKFALKRGVLGMGEIENFH